MQLDKFLKMIHDEIRVEIDERLAEPGAAYPYPEYVFSEIVMQHMSEFAMTFEPFQCSFDERVGNANLKLSGYSVSDDLDQLDLFVTIYDGVDTLITITDTETKAAAEQCLRFLEKCAQGKLTSLIDESNEAYEPALMIQSYYPNLDQIRIYVLTDRQAKSKNFNSREIKGKTIKLEVMDIERLHRHWDEGKPRDELVVNFQEISGSPLPCVYVPSENIGYDYALTAIPGEALRFIYDKYNARLLEANVRSFLSSTGKVNKGIRETLQESPDKFMAYNNGIVVVADEVILGKTTEGGPGIVGIKGMQIVNGGQTTASIYFSKKKDPTIDLSRVKVPAKIIILRSTDAAQEEALISDISRYANSQNSVQQSDLSANKPFHVELERLATTTICPDGVGRWFYERAAGSYKTLLLREGTTPSKLKKLKDVIMPTSRKIIKTDLAKYLNAWDKKPQTVSLGSQKNFVEFMESIDLKSEDANANLPLLNDFKEMVSKAILYKKCYSVVRPNFPAFQSNVTTYLISLLSELYGDKFNFGKVWLKQDISPELKAQLKIWANEVNEVLHQSARGRMVSEWAKKDECWLAVKSSQYSPLSEDIPEIVI